MIAYPPASLLLELLDIDEPGQDYRKLESSLVESGIVGADHVLLLPEEILGEIGDMGMDRASRLRDYARRAIMPVLGLQGSARRKPKEVSPRPESEDEDFAKEAEDFESEDEEEL
jgi:hypothetical protein